MMPKNIKLFFVIILFLSNKVFYFSQQNSKTDSTVRSLPIKTMLEKVYQLKLEGKYEAAIQLLEQAEIVAKEENNVEMLPKIYYNIAKIYGIGNMENMEMQEKYIHITKEATKKAKKSENKAFEYIANATYYSSIEASALAITDAQKAIEMLGKKEKNSEEAFQMNYILSYMYSSKLDMRLSEKYANICINIAKKRGNLDELSKSYSGKYFDTTLKYRQNKNPETLKEALGYLRKAFEIGKKNSKAVSGVLKAYTALQLFEFYSNESPIKKDSIIKYINYAEQISNNQPIGNQATSALYVGKSYLSKLNGNPNDEEKYLLEGLKIAKTTKFQSNLITGNFLWRLMEFYRENKQPEKALAYLDEYSSFQDKIFDDEERVNNKKIEAEYNQKYLKKEIAIKDKLLEKEKLLNVFYFCLATLLIVLLIFFFIIQRNKSKLAEEVNTRLKQEQEEIVKRTELQLQLGKEKQAKLNAEKELLDAQREQMAKEAMANALQINRKNELLYDLQEKIDGLENHQVKGFLSRTLSNEIKNEENTEKTVKEFQEINPLFFQNLQSAANQKLTFLDLKYCAYIYLHLSTKELAAMFFVEPNSIRMTKSRLKKKLNLSKDDDLDAFLQNIFVS